MLNFAPAIAEAYYQNLPLLVFTADRPAELIDQADGQTLRQTNIFANYIKASFELPVETVIDAELHFQIVRFRKPSTRLFHIRKAGAHQRSLARTNFTAIPEHHSNPKIIKTLSASQKLNDESLKTLQNSWLKYKRKLVIFGVFPKNECLRNWPVGLPTNPM